MDIYLYFHCYHPGHLLCVAHFPVTLAVAAAAVSGVKRWLSALLVVKTVTGTLHPSAAGGSVRRLDWGLQHGKQQKRIMKITDKRKLSLFYNHIKISLTSLLTDGLVLEEAAKELCLVLTQ